MNEVLVCVATVALGELGDKTQLLSLLLAVRYRRPATIIAGILVATLVNHLVAAWIGVWIRDHLSPAVLHWSIGLSFLAVAAWTLKPDKLDENDESTSLGRFGLFGLTVVSFFVAEIGDKTQIATALLAARYGNPLLVVSGTTIGMMLVDAPSVILGHRMADRVPLRWVRLGAALMFALLGLLALYQALQLH
jgi:putative Ca2+/H+ antiporter (TMEM165/GDT1 family)